MATYRCPKHDLVFESTLDHRLPGAGAKDGLPAHPVNGHTDCPKCREDAKPSPVVNRSSIPRVSNV